jgi:hypothetical protein
LINAELSNKDRWGGLRIVKSDYKSKRYAKRDRHGDLVDIDRRAEATKESLEQVQWGEQDNNDQESEDNAKICLEQKDGDEHVGYKK